MTWGTAIAALQGNKIDIMFMIDATPERAQAVDFPKTPLLYYSLAVLARDDLPVKTWDDLNKPGVRIAVPQASSHGPFLTENVAKAQISALPRQRRGDRRLPVRAASMRCACSIRRCWPRARRLGKGKIVVPTPAQSQASSARCARTTRSSSPGSTSSSPTSTRAARRRSGTRQFLVDFGLDPKASPAGHEGDARKS